MSISVNSIAYKQFGNCLQISNGMIELVIPLEFGLRILRYGRCGGENLFYEQENAHIELNTPEGWQIYGGHRLWVAPETTDDYFPDNHPIEYRIKEDGIILRQDLDLRLNLKKEIEITLQQRTTAVELIHRVRSFNKIQKHLALWAITAMRSDGEQIIPYIAPDTGMAPNRFISFWPYTDPADVRFRFAADAVTVNHLPFERKFKIGLNNHCGRAYYRFGNEVFSKSFKHDATLLYPDNNVSYQTFLCKYMTEMETLSPLYSLNPGEVAQHAERWEIVAQA